MDRSFAGRLGIGSLTRPPARKKARPNRAGSPRKHATGRGARGGAGAHPIDVAIEHLLRATSALVHGLSGAWALVRERKRLRIALLATLVAMPLLGGGWLWLR